MGWCYETLGRHDEAVAAWEKDFRTYMTTERVAELIQAYRSNGMKGLHQKELEHMLADANSGGYADSFWIAVAYAETGQKDEAFQWLERAYEERFPWMSSAAVECRLSSLHSDPRFAALLQKMGLKMPVWKK